MSASKLLLACMPRTFGLSPRSARGVEPIARWAGRATSSAPDTVTLSGCSAHDVRCYHACEYTGESTLTRICTQRAVDAGRWSSYRLLTVARLPCPVTLTVLVDRRAPYTRSWAGFTRAVPAMVLMACPQPLLACVTHRPQALLTRLTVAHSGPLRRSPTLS